MQDEHSTLDLTLQDVIDSIEDELLVVDRKHHIRFANAAVRQSLRKEAGDIIGRLCYEVLEGRDKPCAMPLWECPLREVLRTGSVRTFIHPIRNAGNDTYLKLSTYPLRDDSGNIQAVVELRRDVTAARELETQILRRHHQLLVLSHISRAVSGLRDLDTILKIALDNILEIINGDVGGILLLNERTRTLHYRAQRGLSAQYTENRDIALGEGVAGRVAESGESILVEDISKDPRAARPDLVTAEGIKGFICIPLKSKDRVVGVMNIFSHVPGRFGADDLSLLNSICDYLGTTIEQTRLYERLERVGERYRVLLRHSLTAQERERKRIARELHDDTAQAMTSLTLRLQALIGTAQLKGYTDPDFLQMLEKTHGYAVQAGTEVVRLMKELRPTLLDELGLPAAIHRYAKDTLQARGINVCAEFNGTDNQRFPPEVEVELYRIAQGAIGNVLEHSDAKNVAITLDCNGQECALTVQDDGKGFDVSRLTGVEPGGRGAGLFIMRERTSLLGGSGFVESEPGKGTKIIARVPISGTIDDLVKDSDEEDKGTNS